MSASPTAKPSSKSPMTRRSLMQASAAAATFAALGTNFAYAQAPTRIKVGLVGCGGRGRGAAGNIVEADEKGVVIHAIGDLFPDAIEETKKLWAEKPKKPTTIPIAFSPAGMLMRKCSPPISITSSSPRPPASAR